MMSAIIKVIMTDSVDQRTCRDVSSHQHICSISVKSSHHITYVHSRSVIAAGTWESCG